MHSRRLRINRDMVLVNIVVLAIESTIRVRPPTPALESVAVAAVLEIAGVRIRPGVFADEAGAVVPQELAEDGERAADYDEVGFDAAVEKKLVRSVVLRRGRRETYIHIEGVATAQGWSAAVSMGKRVTRRIMLVTTVLGNVSIRMGGRRTAKRTMNRWRKCT